MEEIWKPIAGFENEYEVSNYGNVRSVDRIVFIPRRNKTIQPVEFKGITLKPNIMHQNGYLYVDLMRNQTKTRRSIHRLVAQAFLENPEQLPCVNHKDESRDNNCVDNLEWCTAKYNSNYGTRIERQKKNTNYVEIARRKSKNIAQYTMDGVFVKLYERAMDAAIEHNLKVASIYHTAIGMNKQSGGYIWKYC